MSIPLIIQFGLCPIVLVALLIYPAPYGRHHSRSWPLRMPNRLAWFLMELPALALLPWFLYFGASEVGSSAMAFAALWCIHYGYRTLVYPVLMRPSRRTFPAILVLLAIGFHLLNCYNNAGALSRIGPATDALLRPHVPIGFLLFAAGFATHVQSDGVIRRLRRPGESGYAIPHGGLFRWVSSPNYLGEMVQWAGWAIMTWSLAGLAFALFTVCNLLPRAIANHDWYRRQFPHYPKARRVLIPGVY